MWLYRVKIIVSYEGSETLSPGNNCINIKQLKCNILQGDLSILLVKWMTETDCGTSTPHWNWSPVSGWNNQSTTQNSDHRRWLTHVPCSSTISSGFLQTAKLNLHWTTNYSCVGNRFCVFPLPKNSLMAAGAAPFQHTKASLSSFKMKFRRGLGFKRKLRSPIYFWTSKNGINGTNAVVDAANKWNLCIVNLYPLHQWLATQWCNTKTLVILLIFIVFLRLPVQTQGLYPRIRSRLRFALLSHLWEMWLGFFTNAAPSKKANQG